MYAIYCDGECFFNDLTNAQETALISPELSLKDNTAGTLTFTLPKTNIVYDKLTRIASTIVVKRNGEEIWEGRALTEQKDFSGQRKITCEGELGYLNDTIQPQETYENPSVLSFFNAIINKHNEKVTADKQFTVGAVTVDDEMIDETGEEDPDFPIVYTDFTSTLETINEKLISNFGGHIRIRKVNGVRYIDYLKDYVDTLTQKIEFSNNLMDFVIDYDETEFCTVLIPLGEKFDITADEGYEEYLDIRDVNDGKNYLVNEEAKGIFGWIEKIAHFDEVDEESELLSRGRKYLSDTQFGSMKLNVKALDLNLLDHNVEEFKMLYEVEVISAFHGLDKMFPITEIKIPLDNPANTSYTLGDVESKNLSGMTGTISKKAVEAASKAFPKNAILEEAKISAQSLIDSATNGHITIERGENGKTAALYISNTENYETATKKWVWNINGLGYMQDGQVLSAMTMDGAIVADRITTGTLDADKVTINNLKVNAAQITSGTINKARIPDLSADKITSGTLDASNVTISNLTVTAAQITSGTIASARIPNLSADKITSGTLDASNVTINNLTVSAAQITSGTIAAARIPNLSANKITTGTLNADSVTIQSGSSTGAYMKLYNSKLYGYYKTKLVGYIDTAESTVNDPIMSIYASDTLRIHAAYLSIYDGSYYYAQSTSKTGWFYTSYVNATSVVTGLSKTTGTITFTNGLLTEWSISTGSNGSNTKGISGSFSYIRTATASTATVYNGGLQVHKGIVTGITHEKGY